MGAGIAQVAATAGFETVVKEISDDLIAKGFGGIEKS
jgi:3-hydroxybutyryl-CoA dehydrogenase